MMERDVGRWGLGVGVDGLGTGSGMEVVSSTSVAAAQAALSGLLVTRTTPTLQAQPSQVVLGDQQRYTIELVVSSSVGGPLESASTEEEHWDRLALLLILSTLAAVGTIGNIFAIAAVMTEDYLKRKGNVLLVNLMLAGLLVTVGVLPAKIVNLLAEWKSPTPVCTTSWALTALGAHTTIITLPIMAWENRMRVNGRSVGAVVLGSLIGVTWAASVSLVVAQWIMGIVPQNCGHPATALESAQPVFTLSVGVTLVALPLVLAFSLHTLTLFVNRTRPKRGMAAAAAVKPMSLTRDLALVSTNLVVTLILGTLWSAGLVGGWGSSHKPYNSFSWMSTIAATISGFLYAFHKPFRDAYVQLFHYCCCKTSVSLSRRGRGGEVATSAAAAAIVARPASDVRVHIIPGYNMYTTASTRECGRPPPSLVSPPIKVHRPKDPRRIKHHSHSKKDVYEL